MFAHKKNYGRAGYVDDPLPNIVYMAIWMPACIVWLYYASSSTVRWFSDHFFCLVCGPLEKKKKKKCCRISAPQHGLGLSEPVVYYRHRYLTEVLTISI